MSHLNIEIVNVNKGNATVSVRVMGGNTQVIQMDPGRFQDFLLTGIDADANPGKIEEFLGVLNRAMNNELVNLQTSSKATPFIDQLVGQTIDFGHYILT